VILAGIAGCGNDGLPKTGSVTGTIKLNGKPIEGVQLEFTPAEKIRPSYGMTDSNGKYKAQFVTVKSGVALGPCVVRLFLYRGDSEKQYLPAKYNADAAKSSDFNLDIKEGGLVFDYDINYTDATIPEYVAPK
jgi:hypothetical protein